MITFTEDEQTLLDQGWPRMIRLVDGHPHDKRPEKAALAWSATWGADVRHSEWPREAATIAARIGPRIAPIGKRRKVHQDDLLDVLRDHASRFVKDTTYDHAREWAFLVEALSGSDATLDAIADGFEAMRGEPHDPFVLHCATGLAAAVGFILLRAKNRKKHARRFETFRQALLGKSRCGKCSPATSTRP